MKKISLRHHVRKVHHDQGPTASAISLFDITVIYSKFLALLEPLEEVAATFISRGLFPKTFFFVIYD